LSDKSKILVSLFKISLITVSVQQTLLWFLTIIWTRALVRAESALHLRSEEVVLQLGVGHVCDAVDGGGGGRGGAAAVHPAAAAVAARLPLPVLLLLQRTLFTIGAV